jgi:effector-binding domain-containing protein
MNQYRCENCNFRSKDTPYSCEANKNRHIDGFAHVQITETGCASHSDFQSEREKVLGELIQFLDEHTLTHRTSPDRNIIQKSFVYEMIEELRQAGE